jgi:hypothetical protein
MPIISWRMNVKFDHDEERFTFIHFGMKEEWEDSPT